MKLKGNSGFVNIGGRTMHVAAPYDCNGQVFVRGAGGGWRRMDARVARSRADVSVIACINHPDLPAVQLDHYYPYYGERTLCEACARREQERADREVRRWYGRLGKGLLSLKVDDDDG